MSLFEVPMGPMRQAARTPLWELGRQRYNWQQIIVGIGFHKDTVGGVAVPIPAAQCQAAIDTAYAIIMAVDFDNPPVQWFNTNNNQLFFGGVPAHPGPFAPPPYLQTIFGADSDDGHGFSWQLNSDTSVPRGGGDVDCFLFSTTLGFDYTGQPAGPEVRSSCQSQYIGGDTATRGQIYMTRLRLLGASLSCVSLVTVDNTNTAVLKKCGLVEGQIFNPLDAVPSISDPLPVFFAYMNQIRVWAKNPYNIPCSDCRCP